MMKFSSIVEGCSEKQTFPKTKCHLKALLSPLLWLRCYLSSHRLPVTMVAEKNGLLFDAKLNLQRFGELSLENYYSDSECVCLCDF